MALQKKNAFKLARTDSKVLFKVDDNAEYAAAQATYEHTMYRPVFVHTRPHDIVSSALVLRQSASLTNLVPLSVRQ